MDFTCVREVKARLTNSIEKKLNLTCPQKNKKNFVTSKGHSSFEGERGLKNDGECSNFTIY